jgi:DNA-binding transcriptional ArsR family regulator
VVARRNRYVCRVYDVVLGITELTPYADIAELAACSQNAAKKHLDRLAEMGIVRADRGTRPARYARNDGYLEWQEATRIADELSIDEIVERVERLEEHRNTFEETFDTNDPSEINVFEHDDHEMVHERMGISIQQTKSHPVSTSGGSKRTISRFTISNRTATGGSVSGIATQTLTTLEHTFTNHRTVIQYKSSLFPTILSTYCSLSSKPSQIALSGSGRRSRSILSNWLTHPDVCRTSHRAVQ